VSLCALSIATNYALVGVSNVKLMDFIVFFGGFFFGSFVGGSIGVLSWLVYGLINPYGFVPQVWVATMLSESIYGLVGGAVGGKLRTIDLQGQRFGASVFFATLGFLPTVLYDLITTIVYAYSANTPLVGTILLGTPFTLLHEVSNAAIFGVCTVPLVTVLGKSVLENQNVLLEK
jgi:hypothetical protein